MDPPDAMRWLDVDGNAAVVTVAAREPLAALPTPFPAVLAVERTASA
jgi:hypothetical protein